MSAAVLSFPAAPPRPEREALLAVIAELHALITIDPVLGASPSRTYFVVNPEAKARIGACLDPADPGRAPDAYALIAYDFPFALHQFTSTAPGIPRERAKALISCNAALQQDGLARAADALGVGATPVCGFDAAALKAVFFPDTRETVLHVLRLSLPRAGACLRNPSDGVDPR